MRITTLHLAAGLILSFSFSNAGHAYFSASSISIPDQEQSSDNPESPASGKIEIITYPSLEGKDVCTGIRDLSILSRPEVRKALTIYLIEGRSFALRGMTNKQRYAQSIDAVFADNTDMPVEISYLPLLESGFSPFAVSRMKAVGTWQIIEPTARELDLKINPLLDERRDVKKSTVAALHHLRNLMQYFKSWDLALAAYNCGSKRVLRAMSKKKSRDFWVLASSRMLRAETVNYIPRYAALALISSRPDLFHLEPDLADEIETEQYILKYPVKISDLAGLLRVEQSLILELNPELNGSITPLDTKGYRIVLPAGSSEIISMNEDTIYKVRYSKITMHKVRKGDSIQKIAKLYKTDPLDIAFINRIPKPYYLKIGRTLYIPQT